MGRKTEMEKPYMSKSMVKEGLHRPEKKAESKAEFSKSAPKESHSKSKKDSQSKLDADDGARVSLVEKLYSEQRSEAEARSKISSSAKASSHKSGTDAVSKLKSTFSRSGKDAERKTEASSSKVKPSSHRSRAEPESSRGPSRSGSATVSRGASRSASSAVSTVPTKSFRECTITMAADVSNSTGDLLGIFGQNGATSLMVEQQVINLVYLELSREGKERMRIIPWSSNIWPILHGNEAHRLFSAGGTLPFQLCYEPERVHTLRKSSLWFLMTDGVIEEVEVPKFAKAIPEARIHSTACVTINFGKLPPTPAQLNISVGYSVFAVAAHCLMLFHDIGTDNLYLLLAKGCFESLVNGGQGSVGNAQWRDLTQIRYRDIVNLQIPRPTSLQRDEIALSDGSNVNINDVLSNRVSEAVSSRLVANEQDMNTVLTTASSRGMGRQAQEWLKSSRAAASRSGNHESSRNIEASQSVMETSMKSKFTSLGGLGGSSASRAGGSKGGSSMSIASTRVGGKWKPDTARSVINEEDEG